MKKLLIALLLLLPISAYSAAQYQNVRTVTSNYSATITDDVINANAVGGAITVTLPPVTSTKGKVFTVRKTDSTLNAVTVSPNVNGASQSLVSQYDTTTITSSGSDYFGTETISKPYAVAIWTQPTCSPSTATTSFVALNAAGCINQVHYGKSIAPTTAGDIALKVSSLSAGDYTIRLENVSMATTTGTCEWEIYDGSQQIGQVSSSSTSAPAFNTVLVGFVRYSTVQTDKEFKLRARQSYLTPTCIAELRYSKTIFSLTKN